MPQQRGLFPDTFEDRLRRWSKTIGENAGLAVAVAAAVAAIWSGYEAHKTRIGADATASEAIDIQKGSLKAQVDAVQLDERPFISVTPLTIAAKRYSPPLQDRIGFVATYKIGAVGKTPALHIEIFEACTYGEQQSETRDHELTKKFPGFTIAATREQHIPLLLNESVNSSCDTEADPDAPQVKVWGRVEYKDYFNHPHKTTYCFLGTASIPDIEHHRKPSIYVEPCRNFQYEFG